MKIDKDKDPYCPNGTAILKLLKLSGEPWQNHVVRLWINDWGMEEYRTNASSEICICDLHSDNYGGIIELPECNTKQQAFNFSIECNESIRKEYIITCE